MILEKKLSVLNIYGTYFPDLPGGVQEAIRQICLATSEEGVINPIFTLSSKNIPKKVKIDGVDVIRGKSWMTLASCGLGGVSAFMEFNQQAKKHDLLHYHFPWPFADCLNFAANTNQSRVLTYHSDIIKQKILGRCYAPLMWHTLKKMDVIVATSPNYIESSQVLSTPKILPKARAIPLGINESSYPLEHDETIFNKICLDKNEPYFLFLGVHRYYKGIHTLIQAARNTQSKIVIAGNGTLTSNLKTMARQYNLDNVIFTNQISISEKMALFKSCRAFVLPSHLRSEAFGLVLIEASMMGKPMISCEIRTGTSYVNLNGETGLVVPPESPQQLSEAINTLLKDEALANNMGIAARQRYEQPFSGKALGLAYSKLYKELF